MPKGELPVHAEEWRSSSLSLVSFPSMRNSRLSSPSVRGKSPSDPTRDWKERPVEVEEGEDIATGEEGFLGAGGQNRAGG